VGEESVEVRRGLFHARNVSRPRHEPLGSSAHFEV
jgi:hypothetical protein